MASKKHTDQNPDAGCDQHDDDPPEQNTGSEPELLTWMQRRRLERHP